MEIVRSLNINWIYALISADIELFIWGEESGGNVRGKCPDTGSDLL